MKEWLQRHFLPMLSLIALALTIVLAIAVFEGPTVSAGYDQLSDNTLESGVTASGNGSFGYIMFDLNGSDRSSINKTPKTSEDGSFEYFNFTMVVLNDSDRSSINKTPKTNEWPVLNFNSTTYFSAPVYREVVIVYFKEMPVSVDDFASSYNVTPVFVKGDIKMAAFETDPVMVGGVVSEKTTLAIESISKDPRVESVKRDTYMFVDPKKEISTTPKVKYPEDYKGGDYVPNQVAVGFWRLPPSLDEFGEKYGGKPINVNDARLRMQSVVFQTEDVKGFIDRASKDPYVSFIELNPYYHLT